MIINNEDTLVKNLFKDARSVAIFVPAILGKDALAAACAIYDIAAQEGKSVKIFYNGDPETAVVFFPFAKIESAFDSAELVISFNYRDTPIERVSYSTDDGVFKMKISPVEKSFDVSKIGYEFMGPRFDLVVTVGAKELGDLGSFFSDNGELFKKAAILNIDTSAENKMYGTINVVAPEIPSLTNLVFSRIGVWGYIPTTTAVTALLLGMKKE
ncbi:hypothetical protein COT49_00265 [candidate division WWE3 bacterium CG08_land_8_20_14_0_20_40_13]|uniref:Uncharacterized protein n=1 Tax=candidate division WWE3 bacterium CG08_land_8_20_14_0_20_40_13 TaxID=1975084 RepID=A0A2H0XER8_UNCKA|nr:MAG: hypothetical protein COT49_00265 [candidate division WWE3 bacterium CG08_land_8_20_14_0_20_40_13]